MAAIWVAAAFLGGWVVNAGSAPAWGMVAAVAVAPPLIMLHFWKAPSQTMSESIQDARR